LLTVPQIFHKNLIRSIQVDFDYQILDSANEKIIKETKNMIDRIAKEFENQKKIKVTTLVENGSPRDIICDLVQKNQIDILLMGSRGYNGLKSIIIGSVSDYCIKNAKCAVTIVH